MRSKRETGGATAVAPFRLGHRPCLDGLRGISILAVVGLHAGIFINRSAFIGVDIFFVLSGFLITCLLLEEWEQRSTFNIKRFYLRRALRLLPALVAMLTTFVAYEWCFSPRPNAVTATKHALQTLLYYRNWAAAFAPFPAPSLFGHTWTLSIEEQFYLLWPLALRFGLRRTASRVSLLWWVLLAIFLSVFIRFVLLRGGANYQRLYFGTDTRCDALLLGCAGAIALCSGMLPKTASIVLMRRSFALVSALALVWLAFCFPFGTETDLVLGYVLIPLFALGILLEALSSETGILCRGLSQRWLVYVGRLSYGLYLWHHPIFLHVQAKQWSKPKELAVEFTLTGVIVFASYYLLEQPLLRLKDRFAAR